MHRTLITCCQVSKDKKLSCPMLYIDIGQCSCSECMTPECTCKCKMAEKGKHRFEELYDPFATEDIFDRENSCLDQQYKELSEELFGETEERMTNLVREFKDATRKKGIEIPGNMFTSNEFTRVLLLLISYFPDSDHFCKKLLRAGGCDVDKAVKVLHSYLSTYQVCPHFFEDILPLGKNEKAYDAQFSTVLPHR